MMPNALLASSSVTGAGAALLGVLFHLTIRPFEIDNRAWTLIFAYHSALLVLLASYICLANLAIPVALIKTSLVGVSFILGLTCSILLYRGFLHRLRHIPGPFLARFSKLYHMHIAATTLQNNLHVQQLHARYGDFVRTGPREVSVNRVSAIQKIYGPPAGCKKGPWYSQVSDDVTKIGLNSTRDFEIHRRRRRAWERGLGFKALATYESRIVEKIDLFLSRVGTGKPVDVTEYSEFLAFDIMGDIGFSKDFHMLESGREHPAMTGLHESMTAIAVVGAMPWLLSALSRIPGATGGYDRFTSWCSQQLEAKKKELSEDKGSEPRDVISWLIKAKEENDRSAPPGELALAEDSRLLVITGSDTTSGALASAVHFLAKHPATYRKLRQSIQTVLPNGHKDWSYGKIKDLPYLNHAIAETLRLRPSVPVGLQRLTPPEGLTIDDRFIPGDTVVSVPCYTIQRDPRYWDDALQFRPERWEEAMPTEGGSAFVAFSRGQFACPGKNLALMEMRIALSKMALGYELEFPAGWDGEGWEGGIRDTFTASLPPLPLVLKPRSQSPGLP